MFYCYPTDLGPPSAIFVWKEWPQIRGETIGWKWYFFQKSSQHWMGMFLKLRNCMLTLNIFFIHLWFIELYARSVHVSGACLWRAQISMHHKWIKDMFRKSAKYFLNFKNIFSQFWEHFWKTYFFHPRVPPLVFGHYVRTDLVEVGGKFEASNF